MTILHNYTTKSFPLSKIQTIFPKNKSLPVNPPPSNLIQAIKARIAQKVKENTGRKIEVQGIGKGQNHKREVEGSIQDRGKRRETKRKRGRRREVSQRRGLLRGIAKKERNQGEERRKMIGEKKTKRGKNKDKGKRKNNEKDKDRRKRKNRGKRKDKEKKEKNGKKGKKRKNVKNDNKGKEGKRRQNKRKGRMKKSQNKRKGQMKKSQNKRKGQMKKSQRDQNLS